jgi:hypothetical protein
MAEIYRDLRLLNLEVVGSLFIGSTNVSENLNDLSGRLESINTDICGVRRISTTLVGQYTI